MPIFDNWDEKTSVYEAIGQAIGAASRCWSDLDHAGDFDSVLAADIVQELYAFVGARINGAWMDREVTKDVEVKVGPPEPRLGCATTEELFRELIARMIIRDSSQVGYFALVENAVTLAEMLGGLHPGDKEYRTVDSH